MTKLKQTPKFKSLSQESKFWDRHSAVDYFDFSKPPNIDLSKLRPSSRPVTVRLPESLLHSLRRIANKNDIPYQSLMKIFLSEKVAESEVRERQVPATYRKN